MDEALEAYREQKAKKNLQELRWSEKGNLVSVKSGKEMFDFTIALVIMKTKLALRLILGVWYENVGSIYSCFSNTHYSLEL